MHGSQILMPNYISRKQTKTAFSEEGFIDVTLTHAVNDLLYKLFESYCAIKQIITRKLCTCL